ncbi:MAG: flavin reductase family protein [Candidatus Omnitrophica bacterium]|nr:flavin reductase family protein [Candidatus Omnitrophota bacterium]
MKKSIGASTIVFPTPVFIVGSYDNKGVADVMTAAWGGIACSIPPCVSVSIRPERQTHANIMAKKAFTVSIPSSDYLKEADYFGIVSGKNEDKFKVSGLTPVKSDIVDAPYVKEFPFVLECSLFKTLELGAHTVFVGEIKDVKVEESCLNNEGKPDIVKLKPMIFDPATWGYYGFGKFLDKAFTAGKTVKK